MTSSRIEVKGGPFFGVVHENTLVGVAEFCDALERLNESLTGEATLAGYEKFEMKVSGNGRGAIAIAIVLVGEHDPLSKLNFEFELDQTYLPAIISQLRDEFPND